LTVEYELNRASHLGARRESKTTHLLGPELRLALNPRVQLTGFYQYNSLRALGSWNARFAYEFAPLSYLYLVFNDSRSTDQIANPIAATQQFILKMSYQFEI